MSDFVLGLLLGLLLAKSGADLVMWAWIVKKVETFKKKKDDNGR